MWVSPSAVHNSDLQTFSQKPGGEVFTGLKTAAEPSPCTFQLSSAELWGRWCWNTNNLFMLWTAAPLRSSCLLYLFLSWTSGGTDAATRDLQSSTGSLRCAPTSGPAAALWQLFELSTATSLPCRPSAATLGLLCVFDAGRLQRPRSIPWYHTSNQN